MTGHVNNPETTLGVFVLGEDSKIFLQDRRGNTWRALDRIKICQGGFGFDYEGVEKLPRPMVYDEKGAVKVAGDVVVIDFLNGNHEDPIVRGGVRSYDGGDGQLARDFEYMARGYNRYKFRLYPRDEEGKNLGEVRFYCCDNYKNEPDWGLVDFYVSNSIDGVVEQAINIQAGPVLGSHCLFFMDPAKAGFTVSGGSDPVILDKSFQSDLAAALTAIQTITGPLPDVAAMLVKLAAGAYGSTVFKTE